MHNLLSETIWAIHQPALFQLAQLIRQLPVASIASGPAEDAQRNGLPVVVQGATAIIPLRGVMVKSNSWINAYYGLTSTVSVRQAVRSARTDESIEQIVLLCDTPGGSVMALAELGDEVAATAKEKPVIAQVDSMTASAGYYVAAQATSIYAGRMDMIGSIGTRMVIYDMSKAFEDAGIKPLVFDTGEFKSAGEPGTLITEPQQADFQRLVDTYFEDFAAMVMQGRGMSDKEFKAVSDGRTFLAQEALRLGLIDGIQTLDTTLASFQKPAGRSTAAARRRIAAYRASLPSQ